MTLVWPTPLCASFVNAVPSPHVVLQRSARLACVLWLFIATGCPHSQPPTANLPLITTTDRDAEAELREARQLQQAGDLDEATAAYRAFLDHYPNDPLTAVARIALAQIHITDRDGASAKLILAPVLNHADASVRERGSFYAGIAEALLGNHSAAIAALAPMLGHAIDPTETGLLLTHLAEAYLASGQFVDAMRMFDRLATDPVSEEARAQAATRVDEVVQAATVAQINLAFTELNRDGAAWSKVARRALIEADQARDSARTREVLAALGERDVELDSREQEIGLRATRSPDADPQVVGVVLTLSGRAREVGEVALRGLMLAAGLPPSGPQAPNAPQLIFRDDAGDPARAVQAVDELVTVHRAIAIIGPMDGQAARAAAARAQELGVPLIALSPQASLNRAGSMVFRLFTSPEEEAQALVTHALAQGKRRLYVLRPDTAYGKLMESAFTDAITRGQGELVGVTTYAENATSFGREITTVAAANFDALLVADSARKIELIAPALAAGGLWSTPAQGPAPARGRGILLLCPSVGFNQQLAKSVGRYLQGAVFSVPFNANALNTNERTFTDNYRRQFDATPDSFAAFAHDAYKLVRNAVEHGARNRADLAVALTRIDSSDVAGPSRGFSPERTPRQATRLLQLTGSELTSIATAPSPSR